MKFAFIYWCEITLFVTVLSQEITNIPVHKEKADLNLYLKSLNQILDFFIIRKYYLNTVVQFGLFVANANLKKVILEKGSRLPAAIKIRLKETIFKADDLIRIAESKVEYNHEKEDVKGVFTLFSDDTPWITQMGQFYDKKTHLLSYDMEYVKNLYPSFRSYLKSVDPFDGTPTPKESDMCLTELTLNPINYSDRITKCDLPLFCLKTIDTGSDNGYAITHRLLLLQMARYGRRCHVISNAEDRYARTKFCASCYLESMYLELNDFNSAFDLFLEQIFLCALEGHSEFIRRRWLMKIIRYQEREGCFSDLSDDFKSSKTGNTSVGRSNNINVSHQSSAMLQGRCNSHTTALAAGVLGAAIRFLLEIVYT